MSLSPFADRSPLVDLLGEGAEEAAERESSAARRAAWWLFNAGQAAFTVGWSAALISAAVGVAVGARSPRPALWLARRVWAPGLLWGAGTRLEVEGGEQLDWSKPYLFLCNHQSMIDIPAAIMALRCDVRFIAKRELSYLPFLGWYMRATEMILVDRGDSARAHQSIRRAGERVRAGASVLAFPEGTRTRDGRVQEFKKGAFVVAIEAQVPIVPVAIEGAQHALPRGGFRVRPGTIRVRLGEPVPTAGLGYADRDALIARVRRALIEQHSAIGGRGGDLADVGADPAAPKACLRRLGGL